MDPLRIVFFGTPEFAVPTLDALLESRHEVVAVVSQPDRGRGRGRKLSASPVSVRAQAAEIPLLRPEQVDDPAVFEALDAQAPDLGVVVAYGQFIGRRIRELPRLGYMINAHASLLPRYRGAAPVARAILEGEKYSGISVMRVEREMDAGAVGFMRRVEIDEQENCAELTERLARVAGPAILDVLSLILSGEIKWKEQDRELVSFAPKLVKEDGWLDWRLSTRALVRQIHGLAPQPGAFSTTPGGDGQPGQPLRILRAKEWSGPAGKEVAPGTVLRTGGGSEERGLRVATGDGWLVPLEIQRAGAKAMTTTAFLRGRLLPDGQRLGGEDLPEKTDV